MTTSTLATTSITLQINPCNLCPRACGVLRAEGQRGYCGASDVLIIARSALHFWEEPPISGESGSGTIFFTHCPLKCVYCQNAELAAGQAGREVSIEQLADLCLDLQEQGALNINCVTPTHYTPHIIEAVKLARQQGLHLPVLWNTSGYELPQTVCALEGTVDAYLTDFKYASADLAVRYSHAADYPQVALEALRQMVKSAGPVRFDTYNDQERLIGGVVVRHLLLPGALEESKEALRLLFAEFGNEIRYSIMNQYTPVMSEQLAGMYPELFQTVPVEQYEELLDYADTLGIQDYFWQEGQACLESFIASWDF